MSETPPGTTTDRFRDSMRALYGIGQQAAQKQRRRERLAVQQGGICPECGLPLPEDLLKADIDHIIPRSRGGPGLPWNLRLLHFSCNRRKSCKLTDEAVALAAEHGVVLREPPVRRKCRWCRRYGVVVSETLETRPLCETCYHALSRLQASAKPAT